jgi:hypothetical protein
MGRSVGCCRAPKMPYLRRPPHSICTHAVMSSVRIDALGSRFTTSVTALDKSADA